VSFRCCRLLSSALDIAGLADAASARIIATDLDPSPQSLIHHFSSLSSLIPSLSIAKEPGQSLQSLILACED
jgi:hypothetical protein